MNDLYHDYLACWEEFIFLFALSVCFCGRGILATGLFGWIDGVSLVVFWGWEGGGGAWENVIHV